MLAVNVIKVAVIDDYQEVFQQIIEIKKYKEKSDFKDFGLFCVQNGFKNLPSDPKIVSLYLTHLSTKEVKISTIKRRLVSIGVIHKIKGYYLDPVRRYKHES